MHIKCPACGSVNSLDSLLAAEDGAADVVQLAGEMEPAAWRLAVQYLGLFRPRKSKLSWARTSTILGEVAGMIKAAQFERGGQIFSAPLPYWLHGMERVLAQRDGLTLPLKTHGYLLEIMMSIDAKTIGLADKSNPVKAADNTHDPPPPRKKVEAPVEDTHRGPMQKAEAKAIYNGLMSKLKGGSGPAPQTPEEIEANRQRAIEEFERRAALKEEERNHDNDNP
ncbi:MAG TPA: hypothetical protein VFW42_10825 [Fluviicoccus sp.]|nr:hypothetical protein [Fluviicoccus sp.]